jgi:hypothetical protein
MALHNRKADRLFVSAAETKTGNESAPQTYKETSALLEMNVNMTKPSATPMIEVDRGKLGTGQHGTKGELQSIHTPFSISGVERLSDILYLLSYFFGKDDTITEVYTGAVYSHLLKGLTVGNLELPTFTMEYGNGTTNDVFAGCVINEFTLEIPFDSGNGKVAGSFSGFCNAHYNNGGVFTKLATGNMSSGSVSTTSEPIVNGKCANVFMSDALESPFTQSFVDEDLNGTAVNISHLVKSITISGNNGMNIDSMLRAGGCGIINNWIRGVPSITCELTLRKDASIYDFDAAILTDTTRAIEIQFLGPVIASTYRHGLDMFLPKVHFTSAPEDDETPVGQTVSTEVFEDANGDALIVYGQTAVSVGYNA